MQMAMQFSVVCPGVWHTVEYTVYRSSLNEGDEVSCAKLSCAALYVSVMLGMQTGCQNAYGLQSSMQ